MLKIRLLKVFHARACQFKLDVNFSIPPDSGRAVFFGPSGSGKTLAMQCIAGLAVPDQGSIIAAGATLYDSEKRINLPPQKRHCGYMPQNYALFPHLTVLQNAAYAKTGLFGRRVGKNQAAAAMSLLKRLGIEKLADHLPREISGGQKQRAALARALNASPDLLLLDEPFSALDPLLRQQMRQDLLKRLKSLKLPAVIITHDPEDVDAFAGCLVFFNSGQAQIAPDWKEERKRFANAADCLRWLQKKYWGG